MVQGEVLLDHARAEHVRDERHRDPVLVVGEPDDDVREALAVRLDHAQVQLVGLARVRRRALHEAELRVDRQDGVERALDVLDRAAAGREEDRLAERGHVPEQRSVHEVGRGDLERGHVELGEEVRARLVEDGAEERDALLARELAKLEPGCGVQLERLAVLAVRRAEGVLVVVGRVVERARVERAVVALLELDRVDAALLRRVDQRLRLLDVSLVVVTDLGDDVRRLVVGDPSSVHDAARAPP